MLDFSFGEIALVVLVALIVVGPEDLPVLMRKVGRWFGQFKSIADEFREGFQSAMQDSHLEEMEKDVRSMHEEIKYIKDESGNFQRIYDISDITTEERLKEAAQAREKEGYKAQ